MPRNVAGRKARCNSCGYIFTVPSTDLNPEESGTAGGRLASIPLEGGDRPEPAATSPAPLEPAGEIGDWLGEFAAKESTAESAASKATGDTAPGEASSAPQSQGEKPSAMLLDFADKEDILAPPAKLPRRHLTETPDSIADEARSGVIGPTRSYWADLAASFYFFLDGGSLITFIIIVLANLWTVPLSFAGPIGFAGLVFVSGYLCTFYMSVIKETAAGEDELPNVWIDDIYSDLIFSIFRFAGTWAWVLIPAICYAVFDLINFGPGLRNMIMGVLFQSGKGPLDFLAHREVFMILATVGLFFWPVAILGVSLGGSFHGLWPHTIIMTALVAPLPYLAMYGVLLVAYGITLAPYTDLYADAIAALANTTNRSLFWTVTVINSGLSAYAMVVAMRTVGLYYRHYKQKFPWVAE
jgi:hypothetical protein